MRCEICSRPIFLNREGTYSGVNDTSATPTACWYPDGRMTTHRPPSERFIAQPVPSGRFWGVRDTEGHALRFNGEPTSYLSWEGMTEQTARDIAQRYNDGFRPE